MLISYTSDSFFLIKSSGKKCVLTAVVLVADVSVPPLGFLILMCKLFIQKRIQYQSMSTKHGGKAQITALLARTCCIMAMLAQVDLFLNDVSVPPLGFLMLMCKSFIQKRIQYLSMSTKHGGKAQIMALLARTCCFMAMLAQVDLFLNGLKYTQNPGSFIYSQTLINKCNEGLNWDLLHRERGGGGGGVIETSTHIYIYIYIHRCIS